MIQELAILGGVAGLTAAAVGGVYLATRPAPQAAPPPPPPPQPVVGYVPNPLMFPGAFPMPVSRQEPMTEPPKAQQNLTALLQFGAQALGQLPALASAFSGAFTSPTATPTPVPAGPQGTIDAGLNYAAFAEQYAANQLAIEAARSAAVSSWGGSAVESGGDWGNVSDAVWSY